MFGECEKSGVYGQCGFILAVLQRTEGFHTNGLQVPPCPSGAEARAVLCSYLQHKHLCSGGAPHLPLPCWGPGSLWVQKGRVTEGPHGQELRVPPARPLPLPLPL